jgi:hypothetical protein
MCAGAVRPDDGRATPAGGYRRIRDEGMAFGTALHLNNDGLNGTLVGVRYGVTGEVPGSRERVLVGQPSKRPYDTVLLHLERSTSAAQAGVVRNDRP